MSKTIKEFISDYTEFQRIIDEYNTSFQYCLDQIASKEGVDRQQLLTRLQTIEISDRQQILLLQQRVQHQLSELRRLLQIVDAHERQISERRFHRFKAERTNDGNSYVNMGATEEDNQLVQCYYPNNDMIAAVCEQVVAAQGREVGIIMNSESADIDLVNKAAPDTIVLGESNRLYQDLCQIYCLNQEKAMKMNEEERKRVIDELK